MKMSEFAAEAALLVPKILIAVFPASISLNLVIDAILRLSSGHPGA